MSAETTEIQLAAAEFIRDRHLLGAFVGGVLRDGHAAEDVLQEVWVRLAAEVEKGTQIENQPAWCRGVARNLIRRHWEKLQGAKVVADSTVMEAFLNRVEECFAGAEAQEDFASDRLAALDKCVAALPERSQRLLAMKYTQQAAMDVIARESGLSFEAVKKALVRIRAGLLDCVRRKLSQEESTI